MAALHISIAAEPLFDVYGFHITNSLLTTWIIMAVLILIGIYCKLFGTPRFLTMIMEAIWGLTKDAVHEKASSVFPLIITIFLFVGPSFLVRNQ